MSAISAFFSSAGFIPHGYCLLWRPDILALHAVSDLIIAAAYFSIPLAILAFVRQRKDLEPEHKRIAILFGVFILGCGMTHVMGMIVLWRPLYVWDGLIKAFTALVSIFTAGALWPMLPRLMVIPSPAELARVNASLQAEIAAKEAAMAELVAIRTDLESEVGRRTEEVQALARRFQIATEGSTVTIAEQDAQLRYTWLHNAPQQRDSIGRSDADILGAEAAAELTRLKLLVLATGEPLRAEISVPTEGDGESHFDLTITPARVGDGDGLLTAAADITEQKAQQEHLQVILRELSHRAKNLLALVAGIARQTAKAEQLPKTFVDRFGDRLSALGDAYDLLISQDWRGVDLGALVESQLAHILPEQRGRISIDGPPVFVPPEAGQYLALALHELATNAVKHGVLGHGAGTLAISWKVVVDTDGARRVELSWIERGATAPASEHSGFGRVLLESLVPRALKGAVVRTLDAAGLAWNISFPEASAAYRRT